MTYFVFAQKLIFIFTLLSLYYLNLRYALNYNTRLEFSISGLMCLQKGFSSRQTNQCAKSAPRGISTPEKTHHKPQSKATTGRPQECMISEYGD